MKLFIITYKLWENGIPKVIYKGLSAGENKIIFANTLEYCDEKIASFVGIVHALGINKRDNKNYDIFTNNLEAKKIVENKSLNYDFVTESKTNDLIKKSNLFLLDQKKNFIINLYD